MSGASAATRSTTSRQNSSGISPSKAAFGIACSARDGIAPPAPGSGYHSRSTCFLARTIAASKRMTGNRRATSRIVWMTTSRTSALRKSSWAVSFHGKLVPSLPW